MLLLFIVQSSNTTKACILHSNRNYHRYYIGHIFIRWQFNKCHKKMQNGSLLAVLCRNTRYYVSMIFLIQVYHELENKSMSIEIVLWESLDYFSHSAKQSEELDVLGRQMLILGKLSRICWTLRNNRE